MKTFKKVLVWIVVITVYLNIGWTLGTYEHQNTRFSDPQEMSVIAKTLAGGWGIHNNPSKPIEQRISLLHEQIVTSIIWPAWLAFIALSWIAFAIWTSLVFLVTYAWNVLSPVFAVELATVAWHAIIFLPTLIFAGGLAELVGTTGMIAIAWIALGVLEIWVVAKADEVNEVKWIETGAFSYIVIILASPLCSFLVGIPACWELLVYSKKRQE